MTDADLLDIVTRTVLSDIATGGDVMAIQHSGLPILEACTSLYGWADPRDTIARAEMNAVQFVQALHLARHPQRPTL
ncbi:hypothetical protein [Dietzia alimentaria]|uniref:hypothetical protein n=1 Tax=Dietzia alimentaria TaxID=665550 RepID=UPI00029A9111|nr:hypothetical protein [Dietzia alimentaria]